MRESRDYRNIALVGFMGTGKSTVGQIVAGMLHFKFLDTDEMIEGLTQRRIAEIFVHEGEERFRQYEKQVVEHLKTVKETVISTGGGLVTGEGNLEALREHSMVVCLWCSA